MIFHMHGCAPNVEKIMIYEDLFLVTILNPESVLLKVPLYQINCKCFF